MTVTGTSGSLSHSATVSLDVSAAPPTPDFDISASAIMPSPVNAGGIGSSTITVTPVGAFTDDVTLACGGAPQLATCALSPTTITGGSGTATLTITTTPARAGLTTPSDHRWGFWYASLLPIGGFLLVGLGSVSSGNKKRRWLSLFLLGGVLTGVLLLASCGNNNTFMSGTPTGRYTITVTGTSGSLSHNTTVTLAVR